MSSSLLRKKIDSAFKLRTMPAGSIIKPGIDIDLHVEAQRVDSYLRRHQSVVDRHNHALVAFHYLTPEAALWIVPAYMKSIIDHFDENDFIIDVVFGVLSSCEPKEIYGELAIDMRRIATGEEAAAVCEFCSWLDKTLGDPSISSFTDKSQEIWCQL